MPTVTSRDGTVIAFDRVGEGPAVVLVEAAAHYRGFSSFDGLVPYLAPELTVYTYDRSGRGESTDTTPYSPDREVEDLAALIVEAGGTAQVYGYSSGALLALRAAAHHLPISRLAVLEPPLQDEAEDEEPGSDLTRELAELVADGRNGAAAEHFHRSIGVPSELLADMRSTPQWAAIEAVASTLVYDCVISDSTTPTLIRCVDVPTLVLDSQGSSGDLAGWAAAVAAQLPRGRHRSLPGEWHGVPDEVLGPVLLEFFGR